MSKSDSPNQPLAPELLRDSKVYTAQELNAKGAVAIDQEMTESQIKQITGGLETNWTKINETLNSYYGAPVILEDGKLHTITSTKFVMENGHQTLYVGDGNLYRATNLQI